MRKPSLLPAPSTPAVIKCLSGTEQQASSTLKTVYRFSLCLAQKDCCMQTVCFFPLSHSKSKILVQGNPVYRTVARGLGLCSSAEQRGTLWHLPVYYSPALINSCSSSRGSSCSSGTPAPAEQRSLGAHGRASYLPTHTSFCMASSTCMEESASSTDG